MEERFSTIGQQCGPSSDENDHAAVALAALAEGDVLVVADGGAGLPATRAAADAAVRAVAHVCRTSCTSRPSALLGEACGVAHRAVLDLAAESDSSRRIGAHLVAAFVTGGLAAVARAGRAAAYHVRAARAEAVFSDHGATPDGFAPAPLGLGADAPPPVEIEVITLAPGDRLVLTTMALPNSVDHLSLARTAWTFAPQVAAIRLADMARRAGQKSIAVQVLRRDNAAMGEALELLHPTRQRDLRSGAFGPLGEGRRRSRRPLLVGLGATLAALLATGLAVFHLTNGATRPVNEPLPAPLPAPPAPDVVTTGEAPSEDNLGALEDSHPTTPPPLVTPRILGPGELAAEPPYLAGDPPPPAPAEPTTDTPPQNEHHDELRAIFAGDPETAASALRRHIVDNFRQRGERVFTELEEYLTQNRARHEITVLLTLLDSRPPPRTRKFLLDLLPALIADPPRPERSQTTTPDAAPPPRDDAAR